MMTVPTTATIAASGDSGPPPPRPPRPIPPADLTRPGPLPAAGSDTGLTPARRGQELLVALRDPADLTGSLAPATARARVEHRPLSVVIVDPPRQWTLDAAVIAVQDRRRCREIASMAMAAYTMCARAGVEVHEAVVLRRPWAWTRTGRDRTLANQLVAIARARGAELHPLPPCRLPAPEQTSVTPAGSVASAAGLR